MASTALISQGTSVQIATGTGGAKTITAAAIGYPTIFTSSAHGLSAGDVVAIASVVGTLSAVNGSSYTVVYKTTNTFAIAYDSTGLAYTSGGTATPTTFTTVGNVNDIPTIADGSATVIETTNMASTGKEFLMGLPDDGTVSFALDVDWGNAGAAAVEAARVSKALKQFKVILPSGTTPTFTFSAVVLKFAKSAGKDSTFKGTVDLKVSGLGVWS